MEQRYRGSDLSLGLLCRQLPHQREPGERRLNPFSPRSGGDFLCKQWLNFRDLTLNACARAKYYVIILR